MRKALLTAACVIGIAASGSSPGMATPLTGAGNPTLRSTTTVVETARLFCANRFTGRFLHWGPCYPVAYRPAMPRVYCKNRYTGRFIHWGFC